MKTKYFFTFICLGFLAMSCTDDAQEYENIPDAKIFEKKMIAASKLKYPINFAAAFNPTLSTV